MADHGTRSRYRSGCGCVQCRSANASAETSRVTRLPVRTVLVDGSVVQAHLQRLRQAGVGLRRIAELGQVSRREIQLILTAKRPLSSLPIALRLLAVRPSPAGGQRIDAVDTWRRIRWLRNEGFKLDDLTKQLGVTRLTKHKTITASVARRVYKIYQDCLAE